MQRLLLHHATTIDEVNLATCLVINRATHRTNRVDVLDFASRAERCAGFVHRHVDVAAHRALFHLGVAGANGKQNTAKFAHVLLGLVAGANIGARNNFYERHTCPIEIDK